MTSPRRRRDRELEAGSSAHYEDPAYYAKTYERRLDDVRYYAELAEARGRVLEYGCGNGRIAIPAARLGAEVVGIDLSAPMLADLKTRLLREPAEVRKRVSVHRGDMRKKRIRHRFPLVTCPFNALLHLYDRTDLEQFLARVDEHLEPGGELVFDVSVPEPSELARNPRKAHFAPRFRYPDEHGGTMVRYSERFDYDRLRQVLFVAMEFHPMNGEASWMTPMTHRQWYPKELEAILHYNGFRIHAQYGDFHGGAPDREGLFLVFHCKRRKR